MVFMELILIGFITWLDSVPPIMGILAFLSIALLAGLARNSPTTNTAISLRNKYSNINRTDSMNGIEFEKFCAEILHYNGFSNIKITPASGDQGVDIIATKDSIHYAFQCKNYKRANVGNKAIQEVYAGMAYYGCTVSVVITNSHFTTKAKELAKTTHTRLWGRTQLQDLMKQAAKEKYP